MTALDPVPPFAEDADQALANAAALGAALREAFRPPARPAAEEAPACSDCRELLNTVTRVERDLCETRLRAHRAESSIATVRALHQPVDDRSGWRGSGEYERKYEYERIDPACDSCGSQDMAEAWPCPTIRALDTAPGTSPVVVEDHADRLLIEQMCALRPGLRPEQAHAALQALRTLPYALHRNDAPCPAPADDNAPSRPSAPLCSAETSGPHGTTVSCVLAPHTGPWHDTGRNLEWRVDDHGLLWRTNPGLSRTFGLTVTDSQA